MKKIKAWHFVADDRMLAHQPGLEVVPGYIYSEDGPIVVCESGLHGSRKLRDALTYAPGSYLCRVEMWGDVTEYDDKLVARHRHVIAAKDVSAELRLWACWCVRQKWHLLTDERSRNAVDVAERFARGEATQEALVAAWGAANAAWGAANAASATQRAACAAAKAAAWGAPLSAARDAAWAASAAANAASAANAAASAANAASATQRAELERVMCAALGVV